MTYVSPKNLSEAIEELDGRNWTVLAGGTDIFPATDEHALTGNQKQPSPRPGTDHDQGNKQDRSPHRGRPDRFE